MMKRIALFGIVICMVHVQHTELIASGRAHDFDSAQVAWVRTIQTEHPSGVDGINAVTTDAQGNVYITGKSESPDGMRDILTIKYNSVGVKLWSARYDGSAHGFDIPMSLVISADGSVYVLGQSQGIDTVGSYDCVTLKYNASGEQEWVNRFASTTWNDVPHALTMDGNGNVYVLATIKSWDYFGNNNQTAIIKYSGSGVEEWVRIEDGPVNGFGETRCFAVNNAGTIFVGGTSPDSIGGTYKLTVASYSAAGDPLWRIRYNVADTTYAQANDIAIDDSGNVVISSVYGFSDHNWPDDSYNKLLTLKFDSSGQLLWARHSPNEPPAPNLSSRIVRTISGNDIYIVWFRPNWYTSDSLITIKYTMDGNEVWNKRYGVSTRYGSLSSVTSSSGKLWLSISDLWEPGYDSARVFGVDTSGVGSEIIVVPTGAQDPQTRSYIALGPNDALYVGSTVGEHNQTEFSLTKYDLSGTALWNVREDGPGSPSDGSIYAMRLDNEGNIYVAGVCRKGNSDFDFMTAKLNSLGVVEWVRTYDGPAHKNDFCHHLELDGQGNVLVAGTSTTSTDLDVQKEYTLIKYSSDGTELWTRMSEGSYSGYAFDLFVDSQGNSYVAGFEGLRVYNSNGTNIRNTSDATYAVAVDASGAIFASEDEGIVKYDSSGGQLLIPTTEYREFVDIVLDDSGNIFTSSNSYLGVVAKHTPGGAFLWSAVRGYNISPDHFGDLFANTHEVYEPDGLYKLDGETGVTEWVAPGGYGRSAFTIDNVGNAFAADDNFGNGSGFHVRKYNPAGGKRWDLRINQFDRIGASPYVLAADAEGNLYIACDAQRADHSSAPTIIKISPFTVGVEEGAGEVPSAYGLSQNYPNPFNPSTKIRFSLPAGQAGIKGGGYVTLKVFDVLGREVATLVNEKLDPGTYQRTFDGSNLSSGVYFYRLQAGEFAETRKLLLIK